LAASALGNAEGLLQKGRYPQVIDICQQALARNPNDDTALGLMARALFESGNAAQAGELFQRAHNLAPDNPDHLAGIGIYLATTGQADKALAAFEEAIRLKPNHQDALYNGGLCAVLIGNPQRARDLLTRAVKRQSCNINALINLGMVCRQLSQTSDSKKWLLKALKQDPSNQLARVNFGYICLEEGRIEEARRAFNAILKKQPDELEASMGMAHCLIKEGKIGEALNCLETLVKGNSDVPAILLLYAYCLRLDQRFEEAVRQLRCVVELNPESEEALIGLGETLAEMGEVEEALTLFDRCRDYHPASIKPYYQRIRTLQSAGRFEEARADITEVKSRWPNEKDGYVLQVEDGGFPISEADETAIKKILKSGEVDSSSEMLLRFALAMHMDRRGCYDEAFIYAKKANALVDQTLAYDRKEEERHLEATKDFFTEEAVRRLKTLGSQSEAPIFIVGMPRSSTSLVEKILAAHTEVSAAGEIGKVGVLARGLAIQNEKPKTYLEAIKSIDGHTVSHITKAYLSALEPFSIGASRITDKSIDQYRYLGFVHGLFPNARIIYCQRHPLDVVVSIFLQRFEYHHPFAYDLQKIARQYEAHLQYMRHWQAQGVPFYIADYARLLAEPEEAIRELLEYVELPFEDDCLSFHKAPGQVRTASQWQVRQPLYATSKGRWRNYEPYLKEVLWLKDLKLEI